MATSSQELWYLLPSLGPLRPSLSVTDPSSCKALDMVHWVFIILSISYGYGHSDQYTPPDRLASSRQWLFISQPFYAWSLSCAKISVALCLLRIQPGVLTWRIFLGCLIIWQVVIAVVTTYFQLSLCKPIYGSWAYTNFEGEPLTYTRGVKHRPCSLNPMVAKT